MFQATPNEYMSHAQMSPSSSVGKYNQQTESPTRNGILHRPDIIRDPYPYRNTRSRQRHNGELSRSPSTYSASSPHSPSYSVSSIHSPGYLPLRQNSFYDGATSPRSPVSETFSTMSLSRYKDPSKMTVKEATLYRNSLMRHSSLMRTNQSLDDH